uniref:Ankyrin repeat-containing protein n=1 Tax=Rhizophora mucronata TaxID=61149 RepID=A0A2P2IZ91_RHIMU
MGEAYHHWSPVLSHRRGKCVGGIMRRISIYAKTQILGKLIKDFNGILQLVGAGYMRLDPYAHGME